MPSPQSPAPVRSEISPVAFIALSLAAFFSGVSQRVTDPLLPRLAGEFSVSLGAASWVVTVFTIGYGLNQLFFGPVGDRFGKYRVIAWACIGCSLATLLCALAPGLNWLLVARLAAGSEAAAIIPLSMAWIGDVVPYEQRQPVLARFLIGQIVGVAMGQLLGGLAADFLGWRVPFYLLTAGLLLGRAPPFSLRRGPPPPPPSLPPVQGHPPQRMFPEFGPGLSPAQALGEIITGVLG